MSTATTNTELSAEQQKAVVEAKEVLASKQDVLMAIGHVQAFSNIRKYVTVTEILTYKRVKESKQYKGLVYTDKDGNSVTVTDLKDVCTHFFDRSYEAMQRDLSNLEAFGNEFFESAQKMELGYRELRKLRQLPDDQQALVIEGEAVELGDKDAVKELIEDLTTKHNQETTKLKKQVTEQTQLANARTKLLQAAQAVANEKTEEVEVLKEASKHKNIPWKKQVQEINLACSKVATKAMEDLNHLFDLSDTILTAEIDQEHSEYALEMMANVHLHVVDQIFILANTLSMETRERFAKYVDTARPIYSEEEILALEKAFEERSH
ncbi:hypothetical protein SG34_010445 [Thalassomonas viridans]|uniref:Uncharacterized protein n=1 Tax=Thalassomonas viridans TaxID=137584 RepID=A0AAE9Z764_9GAMM|nr:hypothetical protein [Thalassomonas viridans]WDE07265.1 hypothetical protein SG34_010445 [Thalassomonas viridans]